MIRSMTGFGRGEILSEACKITVEIKAVNHRYCDISVKLPRKLSYLENDIRKGVEHHVERGKIDVFVNCQELAAADGTVRLNASLAAQYHAALTALSAQLGISGEVTALQIGRFPDVLVLEDAPVNQEAMRDQVLKALYEAVADFKDSRLSEGERLRADILKKLDEMAGNVTLIEERYPAMVEEYRGKLEMKVRELLADSTVDESRIAAEVVIYADKICVDEETVRLQSHIDNMRDELSHGDRHGSVGRKLDFIAQEMNREANTILSKANDITVSDLAIELKTAVEKIREQVQNIE